ncbi:TdeIII family type II restriction endonuclease [Hoylesella saccharolytica]|uniref:TdeIII family type II restriction endonuclease n=1 Tax=Hoylesella saccharolytica TaxID=633701 RepID=UPI00047192C8|nr:TdeIII family type II restriction endonuclease [Hoylesella saccharolytica]
MNMLEKESNIRTIISSFVEAYAAGFSDRHLSEQANEEGTINMKIHNVFIAALGSEIQYYSALARSLDSSLGNMLERMAIKIATLSYRVTQHVEGILYKEQTDYIAELLEKYKRHALIPAIDDYIGISDKLEMSLRKDTKVITT